VIVVHSVAYKTRSDRTCTDSYILSEARDFQEP